MKSRPQSVQDLINKELEKRRKILKQLHEQIYKRVVELKLLPGETVSRMEKINGVLVEFERGN